MKDFKHIYILTALLLFFSSSIYAQKTISIETLLNEMTSRDEKARFPSPEFTTKQFSSYDRATVAKDSAGWFANWDRTMFIRVEKDRGRTEYVMMDAEGPGAITRFWMTFAGNNSGRGTMRIYIDDMNTPAIEGAAFDILSGKMITDYPLASSVSELTRYEQRGHNLYFPIPYSKRCKVTYESVNVKEDDFGAKKRTECVYYNINYRTYSAETKVIAFSSSQMKKNSALIQKVLKQLNVKNIENRAMNVSQIDLCTTLAPSESKSFVIKGTNAVRHLKMRLEAKNRQQALRSLVIEICFDGERTVWVPAGDFFGIGYNPLYTNTWYTKADINGNMEAWWVMPFKKECVITLNNFGSESIVVSNASAGYGNWKWDQRSMYFGASWHQYSKINTGEHKTMNGDSGGMVDINYVTLKGKGVYVGDGISLFNTTYGWWGEGDEKVYVDGESFPSHIGTGTEDYYGYAWCRPERFTDHPFIAQPEGKGSFLPAYTTNTRLRALDVIPFNNSLVFDMELWHWGKGLINYAPVTFWYIFPGGKSTIEPDLSGVKMKVALKRSDIISDKVKLSLEAENMNVISFNSGKFEYQSVYSKMWSEGMQIYWKEAKPGSKLTMNFHSDVDMNCNITALCTTAKDYASINVYLNGKLIKSDLNLNSDELLVKSFILGRGYLVKGENFFEFEIKRLKVGLENGCIGIDQLQFSKSEDSNFQEFGSFPEMDSVIKAFMIKYDVPGASVAVIKNEKIVFLKGYGYQDIEAKLPVTPVSQFRIASVSKPITLLGILTLVNRGLISLNDVVFGDKGILGNDYGKVPVGSGKEKITIKNLLEHKAGWQNIPNDPMFAYPQMDQDGLIREVLTNRPLVTTPGENYYYSNISYCILGRVIEKLTGENYVDFIQNNVLNKAGITNMHIGGNTLSQRFPNEVKYYDNNTGNDFNCYNMDITRMDSHGAWIASPLELARLMVHIDRNENVRDILPANILSQTYMKDTTWQHGGSLPGTAAVFRRMNDTFSYVILCNSRSVKKDFWKSLSECGSISITMKKDWPYERCF
ncbi:MAG: DUF2961 domain-containing protein [Bacteroidales bacterium]|jgi:CubicO group peptidase (beta-lactamase class C family)